MRPLLLAPLLIATLAPVPAAEAGDRLGAAGRPPGPATVRGPGSRAQARCRPIERRKAEAGVRLLEQNRDLQRRIVEQPLRRSGTPAQVRAYRSRVEAIERADDLRVRQRVREVDPDWWDGLGPHTRRAFEESGIAVRRAERRQRQREELDALERERPGSRLDGPPRP